MTDAQEKYQLLVIEDAPVMIKVIREMLSCSGLPHFVTACTDTNKARELLLESRFDCILLDYELDGINAKTLLFEISKKKKMTTPVIILTGYANPQMGIDLINTGVVDFVSKSECTPELLKNKIKFAIKRMKHYLEQTASANYKLDSEYELLKQRMYETAGVNDYTFFLEQLSRVIVRCRQHERQMAVLVVDIDDFLNVIDTYSMQEANELLVTIAKRLKAALKNEDLVCWINDDQFCIYLDPVVSKFEPMYTAKRIHYVMAVPYKIKKHELSLTASIGIFYERATSSSSSKVQLLHAKTAMLDAKKKGRNKISCYSDEINNRIKSDSFIKREFINAITSNQLFVEYQPKISLATEEVGSAEALIRWQHPEQGLISPDEFIPCLEKSDNILKLDDWLLDTVVGQQCRWRKLYRKVPRVAINISVRAFEQGDLFHKVNSYLNKYQLPGQYLELEMTERLVVESSARTIDTINKIRGLGVYISLDDFGVGYSSLAYLATFPYDGLKIDKAFVDHICVDGRYRAIVECILELGGRLDKELTVEGVETLSQLKHFQGTQCNYIQGFYFSKPLDVSLFEEQILMTENMTAKIQSLRASVQ